MIISYNTHIDGGGDLVAQEPFHIGILNLMHDKEETQARFENVLKATDYPITLEFFYPISHYQDRPVPELVRAISKPLTLGNLARFDGFIITGAPIEELDFSAVQYWQEIQALMDELDRLAIPQLYVCWGAMAALYHFYGIEKRSLPVKYFGVFENQIVVPTPLLAGLSTRFLAPHARYAEMDWHQLRRVPTLTINASSKDGFLFLLTNVKRRQAFVFAHLEYEGEALLSEYQREVAAHPEKTYRRPLNYFRDPESMQELQFKWQTTQQRFFSNWLRQLDSYRRQTEVEEKLWSKLLTQLLN